MPMAGRKPLALISEDTELGLWALTRALEAEGYNVHAAPLWDEAAAALRRMRFSLVLAAVSSPGHAADILADVSRHQPCAHLVLLVEEDAVGEVRLECGPGPDILAKPFDLEKVAEVARSHLAPGDETLSA